MNRLLRSCALLLTACLAGGCANLNFFSEAEEAQLGADAYKQETAKYPTIQSGPDYEMVQRVGRRIANATGKNYQWEFKLLKADDVVNAYCLPGGKVAVYSGLLPITQNENALAVVLGHETAHATQRHGGKRMTEGMIEQGLLEAIAAGLTVSKMTPENQTMVIGALGAGAQIGVSLPFSRSHETEADEVGIRYAIRAGYDPWEAPKLWERMAKLGSSGPSWLSTHPASLDRAENLRQKIPQYVAEEKARPK
jgi:predicted Zn-dependent protease